MAQQPRYYLRRCLACTDGVAASARMLPASLSARWPAVPNPGDRCRHSLRAHRQRPPAPQFRGTGRDRGRVRFGIRGHGAQFRMLVLAILGRALVVSISTFLPLRTSWPRPSRPEPSVRWCRALRVSFNSTTSPPPPGLRCTNCGPVPDRRHPYHLSGCRYDPPFRGDQARPLEMAASTRDAAFLVSV